MRKRNKKKEKNLSWGTKKESIHKRKAHFIFPAPA
jgi:hypothetical protein